METKSKPNLTPFPEPEPEQKTIKRTRNIFKRDDDLETMLQKAIKQKEQYLKSKHKARYEKKNVSIAFLLIAKKIQNRT